MMARWGGECARASTPYHTTNISNRQGSSDVSSLSSHLFTIYIFDIDSCAASHHCSCTVGSRIIMMCSNDGCRLSFNETMTSTPQTPTRHPESQ